VKMDGLSWDRGAGTDPVFMGVGGIRVPWVCSVTGDNDQDLHSVYSEVVAELDQMAVSSRGPAWGKARELVVAGMIQSTERKEGLRTDSPERRVPTIGEVDFDSSGLRLKIKDDLEPLQVLAEDPRSWKGAFTYTPRAARALIGPPREEKQVSDHAYTIRRGGLAFEGAWLLEAAGTHHDRMAFELGMYTVGFLGSLGRGAADTGLQWFAGAATCAGAASELRTASSVGDHEWYAQGVGRVASCAYRLLSVVPRLMRRAYYAQLACVAPRREELERAAVAEVEWSDWYAARIIDAGLSPASALCSLAGGDWRRAGLQAVRAGMFCNDLVDYVYDVTDDVVRNSVRACRDSADYDVGCAVSLYIRGALFSTLETWDRGVPGPLYTWLVSYFIQICSVKYRMCDLIRAQEYRLQACDCYWDGSDGDELYEVKSHSLGFRTRVLAHSLYQNVSVKEVRENLMTVWRGFGNALIAGVEPDVSSVSWLVGACVTLVAEGMEYYTYARHLSGRVYGTMPVRWCCAGGLVGS
jgi:hypothetical protein